MISISMMVGINVYIFLKARKTGIYYSFLRIQVVLLIWMVFKSLALLAADDAQAWRATAFQFFSVCFFGSFIFDWAYSIFHRKQMPLWLRLSVYGIAAVNYIIFLTNPTHYLFYSEYSRAHKVFGPLFYLHTVTSYLLIMISIVHMVKVLQERYDWFTKETKRVLLLFMLFPMLINVMNVVGIIPAQIDLTPIAFAIFLLVFALVSFREMFMDIPLIARHVLYDQMQDGVLILDMRMRLMECNKIVQERLGEQYPGCLNQPIVKLLLELRPVIENYETVIKSVKDFQLTALDKCSIQMVMENQRFRVVYRVVMQRVTTGSNGEDTYYIFRIDDVTRYHEATEELRQKQESLEWIQTSLSKELALKEQLIIAKERNSISKELHDILGHSLTMVRALLLTAKSVIETDRFFAMDKVVKSQELIRKGYGEINQSFKRRTAGKINIDQLVAELIQLGNQMNALGTQVSVFHRTVLKEVSWIYYDAMLRICQEGMTNALRHGEAKHITIGLNIKEGIDLVIADDGKGCMDFQKGNGLTGMEQRVAELAGTFACGSPEGEGFSIHVKIPISAVDRQ